MEPENREVLKEYGSRRRIMEVNDLRGRKRINERKEQRQCRENWD